MTRPRPIRYDGDTWLVMRNDPVLPKAIIRRFRQKTGGDLFHVVRWALDPAEQVIMATATSLERADELVLYDRVVTGPMGGINGQGAQPGSPQGGQPIPSKRPATAPKSARAPGES